MQPQLEYKKADGLPPMDPRSTANPWIRSQVSVWCIVHNFYGFPTFNRKVEGIASLFVRGGLYRLGGKVAI